MRLCRLAPKLLLLSNFLTAASLETISLTRQFAYLEEAVGQTDTGARFWVRNSGSYLSLTDTAINVVRELYAPFKITFAQATPTALPLEPVGFRVHRFSGESSSWRTDVGAWHAVDYTDAFPGIDVRLRPETAATFRLGIRVTVRPGADSSLFTISTGESGGAVVDDTSGAASIGVSSYTARFASPTAWQDLGGRRVAVPVRFLALPGQSLRLEAGNYDRAQPLYLETAFLDSILGMGTPGPLQVDPKGNSFITGSLSSAANCGLTTGGTRIPCSDVWVAGFRPNGDAFFLSRLEGKFEDQASDLRWRSPGELILAGNTASPDFPVSANALQRQNAGPLGPVPRTQLGRSGDSFLSRLNPATGELTYSTYFGGPGQGESATLALAGEDVLVALRNPSPSLAISADAFLPTPPCPESVACANLALFRFNPTLTQIKRATYLPLAAYRAIEAHTDQSVYFAGYAYEAGASSATATPGAFQTQRQGPSDAYLLRLNSDFTKLIFATFYGGPGNESADALFIDSQGQATIAGAQDLGEGNSQSFLAQFSADGSKLLSRQDVGDRSTAITTLLRAPDGRVFLGGNTRSAISPVSPDAPRPGACTAGYSNSVLLLSLQPDGSPGFSTYLPLPNVAPGGLVLLPSAQLSILQGDASLSRIDFNAPATPALLCVTGAASRRVNTGVSPGQIVTLSGAALGPQIGVTATLGADRRFPATLAGVQVRVNGVPAPLLYVQSAQINAILPYEAFSPGTQLTIEVEYAGQLLRLGSPAIDTSVELFTTDFSGSGPAVAVNENGSLNSPTNPAAPGSIIVLYGTGIGFTSPASSTGSLAPLTGPGALARPIGRVTASIGGTQAEVLYAGAAPGLVSGAAQFNIRIPSTITATATVDIRINGSLPANLPTISIR